MSDVPNEAADRKRILLVGPLPPPLTGQALALRALVDSELLSETYVSHVINSQRYSAGSTVARIASTAWAIGQFGRSLRSKPSLVYAHIGQSVTGLMRDTILIGLAVRSGCKLVLHLHGGGLRSAYQARGGLLQALMRWAYSQADTLIVVSEGLRDQFAFLDSDKTVRVVPICSWDSDEAEKSRRPFVSPHDEGRLRLLFLSNVLPSKGLFDVLEALPVLDRAGIPYEFDFAGAILPEGKATAVEISSRLWQYAGRQSGSGRVAVHGVVQGGEKWGLLSRAHVFLLPTDYSQEGLPACIIEAMAMGCTIISTHYRGIPDLVAEGENGFFVDAHRPEQIAQTLIWLWEHPEWLESCHARNQELIAARYTPEGHLAGMMRVFCETLGSF